MKDRLSAYAQLMRLDKPVGTLLLVWPTLAALWIAAEGVPPLPILLAFVVGTFVMRSAGCVINDIADRNFDGRVARTHDRPLPAGRVSLVEAFALFGVLLLLALAIVMTLNTATQLLAAAGVLITIIYPFLKRWTHWPQVVLGAAFSWGIPMAFTAVTGSLPLIAWVLFAASAVWIIAYDTQYAMVDRRFDLDIGLKSSAILFANLDRAIIGVLQCLALVLFLVAGVQAGFRHAFFAALVAAGGLFVYHQWLIRDREESACFKAFRNNVWVGFALFAGAAIECQALA
ncbi:MAG: 4-hydroxybenzoate octaprenyltransferase [Gammaproteobacteria bacterium]|nr:4-hydroxybenzoate octaprenyltransferase [Gammaproteobacteria bacterium]